MRNVFGVFGSLVLIAIAAPGLGQSLSGNAQEGERIAERWCSACHLVSERQRRAPVDAPTFMAIAERSPEAIDALAGFLMDPHPPMPDLSLTREEIRDLLAYIASLRED
jgi:cytochrome c